MALDKLVTKTHRLSYIHLDKPSKINDEDGEAKYSVTLLIKKGHPDIQKIEDMIDACYEAEKEGKFKGKKFSKLKHPLKDGDETYEETGREEYKGHVWIRLASKTRVKVFDKDKNEIIDLNDEEDGIKSGDWGRVTMAGAYGYAWKNTNFGFGFFLNSVMKTKSGERLGGYSASADDYDDEDDTPKNNRRSHRDEEDEDDLL